MTQLKLIIYIIIYLPLLLTYLFKINKDLVQKDLEFAYSVCRYYHNSNSIIYFLNLIAHLPEWRQTYLYRLGNIGRILSKIYAKNLQLHIHCDYIGGGLFIQHGHSTEINAQSIGERCQIWQNVTIGVKYSGGGRPVIGDNVKVSAGACILGDICIGNNVTIGANAVVLKDIPDNCIAVGVPARIIKH